MTPPVSQSEDAVRDDGGPDVEYNEDDTFSKSRAALTGIEAALSKLNEAVDGK